MKTLAFFVYGLPQGKGAARHTGKFTYTPSKTRQYMSEVKDAAVAAGAQPHSLPCTMRIVAHFPIPKSYSRKEQEAIRAGGEPYVKKPDTDNLSKIKDGLNGIAFYDDSQVFHEEIHKAWTDRPRLEIEITYYDTPEDILPPTLRSYSP